MKIFKVTYISYGINRERFYIHEENANKAILEIVKDPMKQGVRVAEVETEDEE